MGLNVTQQGTLARGVEEATASGSDGRTRVTSEEAAHIIESLRNDGASLADVREALPSLDAPVATALTAALDAAEARETRSAPSAERLGHLAEALPADDPARVASARIEPAALASELRARFTRAAEALSHGDTAGAARELAPLVDPENPARASTGHGWTIRGAGGDDRTLATIAEELGVPHDTAMALSVCARQAAVVSEMSTAVGHPVAMPPTADDLHAYGEALASRPPAELASAFQRYTTAFCEHIHDPHISPSDRGVGDDDIVYPNGVAADAMPPAARTTAAAGRAIIDCDGYALLGESFFSGAGYRTEFVAAQFAEGGGGHMVLVATPRRGDAVVVSSAVTSSGSSADAMIDTAFSTHRAGYGERHRGRSYSAVMEAR